MEKSISMGVLDDNRKIFNGITFVLPKVKPSTIKRKIDMLSVKQLIACKDAMTRRDCYDECKAVRDIYGDAQFQYSWCIRYISDLLNKESQSDVFDNEFEVVTADDEWGTVTSVTSNNTTQHFMWGCESVVPGVPDVTTAAVDLLESMYDLSKTDVRVSDPPVSSDIKSYHPVGMDFVAGTYKTFVERDGPRFARGNIDDLVVNSPVKAQVLVDIASSSPSAVNCTARKFEAGPALSKCANIIKFGVVDDRDFVKNTNKATKLAASIGSSKKGMGRLRHIHYDGIPTMSDSTRKRYEWITDFIYQPAQVYLLDTKDEIFAYALYRTILDEHKDGKFIVVYSSNVGSHDLKEFVCSSIANGVTITKNGVVGVSSGLWREYFMKCDTYYISFQQPLRTGGSGRKQILALQAARQSFHSDVVVYSKFMYYAFIGAMKEEDRVFSSCHGRDTRVIFSNKGVLDRMHAMYSVLACVKHALLYPYLAHAYLHRKDGFYRYPGIRGLRRKYDLSPPTADERDF